MKYNWLLFGNIAVEYLFQNLHIIKNEFFLTTR